MRYRVTRKSYLDGHYYKPGDVVEFDGRPGTSLDPLGPTRKEQAEADRLRREADAKARADAEARRDADELASKSETDAKV